MTSHAAPKRRPARRGRKPGFWSGLRRATHTDRLRHRVGGAAGRALVRGINRHRAKRGKPPIPIVGDWFDGSMKPRTGRPAGRPKASRGRRPGGPRPRVTQPAFSGPHVRATNRRRKAPLGGTTTSSMGLAGPGNRGAGAGMGAPVGVTGAGGGRATAPPPVASAAAPQPRAAPAVSRPPARSTGTAHLGYPTPTGMPASQLRAPRPVGLGTPSAGVTSGGRTKAPRESYYVDPQTGETKRDWPDNPLTGGPAVTPGALLIAAAIESGKGLLGIPDKHAATTNGSTSMGNIDQLSEPPATDAQHLENINGLAEEIQKFADQLGEYVEACKAMGMDDDALSSADACVENLAEAASAAGQMASDYESTYSGVRETAAAGTSIPGRDGQPATFWDEIA